jgi:PadR family transcriptional regulator PadR
MLTKQTHFTYSVGEMGGTPSLGEFEQMVLLAILRVGKEAYGVSIRSEIQNRAGRNPSSGALYTTLDRLEEKGLLNSRMGDPSPQRGGRAKRFFDVTPAGIQAVARAQRSYKNLMSGLRLPGLHHA